MRFYMTALRLWNEPWLRVADRLAPKHDPIGQDVTAFLTLMGYLGVHLIALALGLWGVFSLV